MKIIIIVFLTLSVQKAFAQDKNHHTAHASTKKSKHEETGRFKATEELKTRMHKIVGLMKEIGEKKGKEVPEYGTKISTVVSDIFTTCKLPPDADAALHPLLGKILEGSEELKSGHLEKGRAMIHSALLDYGKIFSLH